MVIAAYRDNAYNLFLLLHLLAVLVAFAPAFVSLITIGQLKRLGGSTSILAQAQQVTWMKVALPALVLAGFFGIVMIPLSDKFISFGDAWVSIAFLIWFAMIGVLAAGIAPALRRFGAGDDRSYSQAASLTGVMHLLLLVMLYLMVFKPGA